MEEKYAEAHKKIREDPDFKPKDKKGIKWERKGNKVTSSDGKDVTRSIKLSLKQRKEKVLTSATGSLLRRHVLQPNSSRTRGLV